MDLFCLDANVYITSWKDRYPIEIFPSFWTQLSEKKEKIILIKPVFMELEKGKDQLFEWIEKQGITIFDLNDEVEHLALDLESEYETDDNSKGAGSVDIKLIAYAKICGHPVVTYEAYQKDPPGKKCNYKIPLICEEQGIECIDMLEFLRGVGLRV